jgi:hypothetical protein
MWCSCSLSSRRRETLATGRRVAALIPGAKPGCLRFVKQVGSKRKPSRDRDFAPIVSDGRNFGCSTETLLQEKRRLKDSRILADVGG